MEHVTFGQWLSTGGDYVVYLGTIVVALTAIVGFAYKGVRYLSSKWEQPAQKAAEASEQGDKALHERIDELEAKHAHYDGCLARDQRMLQEHDRLVKQHDDDSKMMLRGVLQLLNHGIDGNHTEQLIAVRDEVQEYLLSR